MESSCYIRPMYRVERARIQRERNHLSDHSVRLHAPTHMESQKPTTPSRNSQWIVCYVISVGYRSDDRSSETCQLGFRLLAQSHLFPVSQFLHLFPFLSRHTNSSLLVLWSPTDTRQPHQYGDQPTRSIGQPTYAEYAHRSAPEKKSLRHTPPTTQPKEITWAWEKIMVIKVVCSPILRIPNI